MRDLHNMCRICLSAGSRDLFESSLSSHCSLARDSSHDLARLAEKLRYVTLLKVNPKENLPRQICDLCIVQLNVSYNFKRLASKNDFQIRQYMIENGLPLAKDDDDSSNMETSTALEIHQIQHNVIRTSNRFRQIAATEIRRNSTTSSVSGASTMIINGRENDATPISATNHFVHPRPIVRPIQIKTEPEDPEKDQTKEASPATSSPSNVSEPSIVTVCSSNAPSEKTPTPMVVINGAVNDETTRQKTKVPITREKRNVPKKDSGPAPLSVKLGRRESVQENVNRKNENEKSGKNLRTIKKDDVRKSKRKLQTVVKKTVVKKDLKKIQKKNKADPRPEIRRPRGRPRKNPGSPPMKYKKRQGNTKS